MADGPPGLVSGCGIFFFFLIFFFFFQVLGFSISYFPLLLY